MIENLEEYLMGIVIGIRFRANFSIEDQLGKIADTILYKEDSYFNPTIFPKVNASVGQKTLFNPDNANYLRVDNSNIILDITFDKSSFSKEDIHEILNEFNSQIINGIMKDFGITEIRRIGFIRNYIFTIEELAKKFVEKTIGNTFTGINDLNLLFSKKIPVNKSLAKREFFDYDNVIFNIIKKSDLNEIFMSIDYQSLFDPFLTSSTQIPFFNFIDKSITFNNKTYLPWLNNNYMEVTSGETQISN